MERNSKAIQLKSRRRHGCLLSPYLFNVVLEVLARTLTQLNEIKGIGFSTENMKLYNGKKKASATNSGGLTGCQHSKEFK